MKRSVQLFLIALLVICLTGVTVYFKTLSDYKSYIDHLTIGELHLDTLADGRYIGQADSGMVAAKVKVTVKDHRITAVEILEHKNGKGEPAEAIVDSVIEDQSLNVDVVSGATGSSKIILKAIEDALTVPE